MSVSLHVASAVAFMAAFSAAAADVTRENETEIIVSLAADPEQCNIAVATEVDLQMLARDPQEWAGQCIAVDGYWQWRALYFRPSDILVSYPESNDELNDSRIGIYGSVELMSSASDRPISVTAVGIAGQCQSLWNGAIMVIGYCHQHTDGPYIAIAEMHEH